MFKKFWLCLATSTLYAGRITIERFSINIGQKNEKGNEEQEDEKSTTQLMK